MRGPHHRHLLTRVLLGMAVVGGPFLSVAWGVTTAEAQFDDEFDDEFDEPELEPEPAAPADEAGAEDEFDEAFDEEETEQASEEPASEEPAFDEGDLDELDAETTSPDEGADEPDEEMRDRLFRTHNSYFGPTGGLHAIDAGGGAVGTFRLQLATEFFFSSSFINEGDQADHIGGSLSLAWTVHENIELWMSIQSYANANDTGDPELFQVLGDTQLGLKGFYRLNDVLTLGGDVTLALLNTVGDIGVVFKGTSFGLRANLTADLRGLSKSIPFITRFNLQYFFDNSERLIEDVEDARLENLPDRAADPSEESRHLLTTVERFALNINRTDFFNINLGFEAPLKLTDDFYLHPLLEWTWNIPVNRQGYNCLEPVDSVAPDGDSCLTLEGVASFPMNLTLGARILPPVDGLSILLAADIGLTGKSSFVRELAPNAPYNLYLGMSYAFDPNAADESEPMVREVVRRVEVPAEAEPKGRVRGTVVEQGTGTPVAGAIIGFPETELTSLVANESGVFTTYRFDPGNVRMAIRHPDYNDGTCNATIPEPAPSQDAEPAAEAEPETGSEDEFDDAFGEPAASPSAGASSGEEILVEVRCELVALPRMGSIAGRVVSDAGAGVAGATIQIRGPVVRDVSVAVDGSFRVQELRPGTYTLRVEAEDFLIKMQELEVVAREEATPTITLVSRPRRPLAVLRGNNITIRRKINFATNSAEILPSSEPLLTEIADVMIRNPNLQVIEVQGHTDNTGPRARNTQLSQERADSVRSWLVSHGVAGTRLQARGYGPDRPIVPNITPGNRARNRRVQFVIQERAE